MGKGPNAVTHALMMFNADDQQVDGTATVRDLAGARLVAQGVLKMMPQVAYINIHLYGKDGMMAPQPIERVDWDQEWAES